MGISLNLSIRVFARTAADSSDAPSPLMLLLRTSMCVTEAVTAAIATTDLAPSEPIPVLRTLSETSLISLLLCTASQMAETPASLIALPVKLSSVTELIASARPATTMAPSTPIPLPARSSEVKEPERISLMGISLNFSIRVFARTAAES